ncbi:hypothetical protein [Candidatus Poriferisodalis sp.]|uniref:hypothetical protein n=1 Tax=Candidatus Poriferisodalis sp. TaxID=3101277 RepID=UPI003B0269A2
MPADHMPTIPASPAGAENAAPAALRLVGGTSTAPDAVLASTAGPLRELCVRPWDDPKLARRGHDPRSAYAERFWVAVLGPSAMWFLRLLARELDELAPGEDLRLDLDSTARRLGLQHRGGRTSTFMRTVDRCVMFGLARFADDGTLMVRTHLPPVPRRLHDRLPRELRDEIEHWFRTGERSEFSLGETRLLASCMLMLGHGLHESAERLVTLGVAPNAANEVTAWAWAQRCTRPRPRQHR